MKKLITILFNSDEQVMKATAAIQQLTANGDIVVIELYIVSKSELGKITIKNAKNQVIIYPGADTYAGSIIEILKDPLTVANGALAKKGDDLRQYHKTVKLLQKTFKTIPAGKIAVVAQIEEYWEIPLNMTLERFDVNINRVNINEYQRLFH